MLPFSVSPQELSNLCEIKSMSSATWEHLDFHILLTSILSQSLYRLIRSPNVGQIDSVKVNSYLVTALMKFFFPICLQVKFKLHSMT